VPHVAARSGARRATARRATARITIRDTHCLHHRRCGLAGERLREPGMPRARHSRGTGLGMRIDLSSVRARSVARSHTRAARTRRRNAVPVKFRSRLRSREAMNAVTQGTPPLSAVFSPNVSLPFSFSLSTGPIRRIVRRSTRCAFRFRLVLWSTSCADCLSRRSGRRNHRRHGEPGSITALIAPRLTVSSTVGSKNGGCRTRPGN
jgi:hypothetical protein